MWFPFSFPRGGALRDTLLLPLWAARRPCRIRKRDPDFPLGNFQKPQDYVSTGGILRPRKSRPRHRLEETGEAPSFA